MYPAGPPVSGYLEFCRKALARREKLRKVRKCHKHNYTYKAPLRGVGCSPRGDASWHDTAENQPISSSSGNRKQRLLLTYAFEVKSKLALCHMKKKHVVFLTIYDVNFSCVCQTLQFSHIVRNVSIGKVVMVCHVMWHFLFARYGHHSRETRIANGSKT